MEEERKEKEETYEEVKASVTDVPNPQDAQESEEPEAPKPKAKGRGRQPKQARMEEPKAKPAKSDKVECADCGKFMSANNLRYKHKCKPPKSEEIQKERPRKARKSDDSPRDRSPASPEIRKRDRSPDSPRAKMVKYYREARLAQQENKRARYRSWFD